MLFLLNKDCSKSSSIPVGRQDHISSSFDVVNWVRKRGTVFMGTVVGDHGKDY